MFESGDRERILYIRDLISDIEMILGRHGGVKQTMDDTEGSHAILMCLMQIGEALNKIHSILLRAKLPVDLAYAMRNIIAHDYLGVNMKVIEQTLEMDIPELKDIVEDILG